ncbi:MAG: cyclase family protein [Flavobacterium sp.]|nr:MAG: cyclase family protein [Flavobacterium sp.]
MKITLQHNGAAFEADLSQPIDISITLSASDENPIAWYLDKPVIEPVKMGEWTGSVHAGASTNFNNIFFNPHGHGTHTECLGHITKEFHSINTSLTTFFFFAEVISILPETQGDDLVITKAQLEKALGKSPEAVIIRTLPNDAAKNSKNYSNTNPPYLEEDAATFIRECGIKHLLIDLLDATITEMVFVPDEIADGNYILNLQIVSFENDASPSKPVLYKIDIV